MILRCTFEQNIVKVVQLLVFFALEFQRSPLCLGFRLRVQLLLKKAGLPIFEWAPWWYLFSPLFLGPIYLFSLNALLNNQLFCFALAAASHQKEKQIPRSFVRKCNKGREDRPREEGMKTRTLSTKFQFVVQIHESNLKLLSSKY